MHKLDEATRNFLISKSKSGQGYNSGEGNRWTAKSKCSIANTVKDYNKIDMDTFWKKDILKFKIAVKGETDDYLVTVEMRNILDKLQDSIERNNNLINPDIIYKSLVSSLNGEDIKVSCTCSDFKYRFKAWATTNSYNAGDPENRPSEITNPKDHLGAACKHVLHVLNNSEWLRKIASVINNYINYCKDNLENIYSEYIFPKLYGMSYKKAVQLTFNDLDSNGNLKKDLDTDEATINLANALGKARGKFVKGSNKNPARK